MFPLEVSVTALELIYLWGLALSLLTIVLYLFIKWYIGDDIRGEDNVHLPVFAAVWPLILILSVIIGIGWSALVIASKINITGRIK